MTAAGFTTRPAETLLTTRATDFLAAGPAAAASLISAVCQLPAVPGVIAEHMAAALFAGRTEFTRDGDGLWRLASSPAQPLARVAEERYTRYEPPAALVGEALDDLSFVVVDVETTGSSPHRGDRITEIAAVRVERGGIRDVFSTLVNPERSIPPFITALTRITWNMVKDAPRFADVCDEVLARLDGAVFVAHNATFDWKFVSAEVSRVTGRRIDGRRICTVKLARAVLPQLRRRSLDWVCNHYGVEITDRHRASGDAVATAQCLIRMLGAARGNGCTHWPHLEALLGTRRQRRARRRPPAMPTWVTRDTSA